MAKFPPRILGLCAAVLLSLPCAAYTPDPSPVIEILDTQEAGAATLILETTASGADIYLDRIFLGRTPHKQSGIVPGVHVLRLELSGYRPRELVLDLVEKRTYTIKITLIPRTGRLAVTVTPSDARVYVDGSAMPGGTAEVPAGLRSVRASRFGYTEAVQQVNVPEDGIASAAFVLDPAPFTLSELRLRRPSFNPANVGSLGAAELRFSVTSFGRAEIDIRNAGGDRAALLLIPPFTENDQTAVWDGRDESGRPLPDGEYSIELRAFPETGSGVPSLVRRATVTLDSSVFLAPRGLSAAVSGLALFPDPFRDPDGVLRFHGSWRPVLSPSGSLDGSTVSAGMAAAFGGAWEAAVQGSFDPESGNSWSLGAGVKRSLARTGSFHAAAFAAFAAGAFPAEGDPASAPPARAGLTAALGSAQAHGGLALELELPSWADPVPRMNARAGLALSGNRLAAGLSAAVRTKPLDLAFALDGTMRVALEARAFLVPLPLALSLTFGADFDSGGLSALRPALELSLAY